MSEHHIVTPAVYVKNLIALLILMFLTIAASWIPLPHAGGLALAMIIAIAKLLCILFIFMHVKYSSRLVWIFASAGFVFLIILFSYTFADYATRNWISPFLTNPPFTG